MKVGKSYKRNEIPEGWDVIIIGSGISGLTAAKFLSDAGKKVLVLEKHYVAGGFTHVFKRPGYEWDVGIHYIGEVSRPGSSIRMIFDDLTDSQLKWEDMGEIYDKMVFPDRSYNFVKGVQNWIESLSKDFPGEEDNIRKYVSMVKGASGQARNFFADKIMPPFLSKLVGPLLRRKYLKYARMTTKEVLESVTSNKKLQGVLAGQFGDYGVAPENSSFAMHSMVVNHYFNGGAYPIGGSARIAETIYPLISKSGSEIYVNAGVKRILVENGIANGVEMEDGKKIFAPMVISSAGFQLTYQKLLDKEVTKEFGLDIQIAKVEESVSYICLYVGMKDTVANLGMEKPNLWVYPGYDHDKNIEVYLEDPDNNPLPVVYISFPAAKDPDFENRYPGSSTLEIISLAPWEWFEKWEDSSWKKRGEEYEALKEKYSQRLLKELYNQLPQLEGKIDYYELSTPLSAKNFVQYQKGELYGLNHTPNRFNQKFLRPSTPIKGLFLTGQDIITCGIGGALMGGVLTASYILRKNLPGEITKRQMALQEKINA